jgi:gliding motility-associated protein GldL
MKPGSKSWKKFMAKLYGWGASVVIIGALFKIQHYPYAGPLLIIGLGTEALIFFFSAFEPVHEEPDWSLVYPQLRTGQTDQAMLEAEAEEDDLLKGVSVSQQLDEMLIEAKVDPELISSLGEGLKTLSNQAEQISDISDAQVATNEYVDSVKTAAGRVDNLSETYKEAADSLTGIASSSEEGATTGVQLQRLSTNLEKLNDAYESQLAGSTIYADQNQKLSEGIHELLSNLNASIDDTRNYKESIAELSKNLAALNKVYGNMLTAMNPGGND